MCNKGLIYLNVLCQLYSLPVFLLAIDIIGIGIRGLNQFNEKLFCLVSIDSHYTIMGIMGLESFNILDPWVAGSMEDSIVS